VTLGDWLDTRRQQAASAVSSVDQHLRAAQTEAARLEQLGVTDPNARLLRERERLDARLQAMDVSLGSLLNRFIDPQTMPALLEDMVRAHGGLKLVRVQSLPAQPLDMGDEQRRSEQQQRSEQEMPLQIFRHPLRLEFEGGYFDVLGYLSELERGPWELGWRSLTYEVADYPTARITLEVETLSRDKNWIGV
jgi:MSHA biogenesis protein MshJ